MEQFPQLSKREWEVVNLLREGKSNKLIASALHISERTVEFHLNNIYNKVQVSSRVELVLKLGESTVADNREIAVNRDELDSQNSANSQNWTTKLKEAVSTIGKEIKMTTLLDANDDKEAIRDEDYMMTFSEAIRLCLSKYAEFRGRATRAEFWWFTLFVLLVTAALLYVSEVWASIFQIAMLLPLLAAGSRRLHDIGRSGWWLLFILAPVGGLVLLVILWAQPSTSKLPDDTLVV
jgi:DNA-binding CsgD family transcriptional regulator